MRYHRDYSTSTWNRTSETSYQNTCRSAGHHSWTPQNPSALQHHEICTLCCQFRVSLQAAHTGFQGFSFTYHITSYVNYTCLGLYFTFIPFAHFVPFRSVILGIATRASLRGGGAPGLVDSEGSEVVGLFGRVWLCS
jgi:hypothetical protein